VVDRINLHSRVIAPSTELGGKQFAVLRAAAGKQLRFALREGTSRIAREPPGIGDGGKIRARGGAVANGHIAGPIHGNATHPAVEHIGHSCWSEGALLENGRRAARVAELIPAWSHLCGLSIDRSCYDRVIQD